jgi:ABC-type molybdate transport system substrate-binding protein
VVKTAWIIAAAKLAATGVVLASGMAQAAEIKVLSSAAFREAYLELVPAFERATEHKVATTWAGTNGIMERMQRGETTGFQQVSELLPVVGIDYVGPLPPDIQQITVFAAGLHTSAKETEAAKALVKFLTAPQAAPVIRKKGMEPG